MRDETRGVEPVIDLPEGGDRAEVEVLPAQEERPAEPRPPAVRPETGAPAAVGTRTTLGGLMLALGTLSLMRRRRDVSSR